MDMGFLEKIFVNNLLWNKFTKRIWYLPALKRIPTTPKKILEIGCGVGKTSAVIKDFLRHAELTAIDFDAKQIAITKRIDIDFRHADAKKLPFKSASFDTVVAFMAFHHIKNYTQAIKEVQRVLQKNGTLCVVDTGNITIHHFQNIFPSGSIFSKEEFSKAVELSGFVVQKSWGNNIRFSLIAKKT